MTVFAGAISAGALSALCTWAIRETCVRRAWLASPVGDRLHHAPTPRFGGIAIAIGFAGVCALSKAWADSGVVHLLLPALGMFLLGLVDDIWQLAARIKLVFQIALAIIPVAFGVSIPLTHSHWLNGFITILWFVGLSNAFNLLDNMNGLCAGTAIIVAVFRGLIAFRQGDQIGFLLCITLAASVFGFLLFNFPKGLVFMGDSGALFLGYTLAGFAFTGTYTYLKNYLDLMVFPVLLMLVPICDTTFVAVVRVICGRPISMGGRDHLSHSLVASGLSAPWAVLVLWAITAGCGVVSLIATVYGTESAVTLALMLLAWLIATTVSLAKYQIAISRAVDLFRENSTFGVTLTIVSDALVATSVLYAVCVLGQPDLALAHTLFLRALIPVVGSKLVMMVLLGCYFRVDEVAWRWKSFARLALAGALGSFVLGVLVVLSGADFNRVLAGGDFLACVLLILGLRTFQRTLERRCSPPIMLNHASQD